MLTDRQRLENFKLLVQDSTTAGEIFAIAKLFNKLLPTVHIVENKLFIDAFLDTYNKKEKELYSACKYKIFTRNFWAFMFKKI